LRLREHLGPELRRQVAGSQQIDVNAEQRFQFFFQIAQVQQRGTGQAVIMSLIVIGEAATKVMDGYVEFTQAHADVPWRSMRNMRNRMAHGYFDINLDVVWETVQEWLPALLQQLPAVRQDADDEDRNDKGMEP